MSLTFLYYSFNKSNRGKYLSYNIFMYEKDKKTKKKKFKIDTKNMGVNIDKNEYQEIILSQTNHPERFFR